MTNRREFLMLADTFNADKHDPVGMIASEKLDGNRCFWDGGVTRGKPTIDVPWSSIFHPVTGDLKDKIKPVATGLWSRYGNPIQAPDWFLNQLPPVPLDGELYAGRGNFQLTQSIVRRDDPDAGDWEKIKFLAFGAPTFADVLQSGLIKNANFQRFIDDDACFKYLERHGCKFGYGGRTYRQELATLADLSHRYGTPCFDIVDVGWVHSMNGMNNWLKRVVAKGGEGLMLRDPNSGWEPRRSKSLLKVKPRYDAEAVIVGFYAGEKGKTGQFLGKLGGLICEWHGSADAPCGLLKAPVQFEIGTGLTHEDRGLGDPWKYEEACQNPGKPLEITGTEVFDLGDRVTFSYMGVTNDLKPREPAYLRIRGDE